MHRDTNRLYSPEMMERFAKKMPESRLKDEFAEVPDELAQDALDRLDGQPSVQLDPTEPTSLGDWGYGVYDDPTIVTHWMPLPDGSGIDT